MNLKEVVCQDGGWIDLAQDRDKQLAVVGMVMKVLVVLHAGNFSISRGTKLFKKKSVPCVQLVSQLVRQLDHKQ